MEQPTEREEPKSDINEIRVMAVGMENRTINIKIDITLEQEEKYKYLASVVEKKKQKHEIIN